MSTGCSSPTTAAARSTARSARSTRCRRFATAVGGELPLLFDSGVRTRRGRLQGARARRRRGLHRATVRVGARARRAGRRRARAALPARRARPDARAERLHERSRRSTATRSRRAERVPSRRSRVIRGRRMVPVDVRAPAQNPATQRASIMTAIVSIWLALILGVTAGLKAWRAAARGRGAGDVRDRRRGAHSAPGSGCSSRCELVLAVALAAGVGWAPAAAAGAIYRCSPRARPSALLAGRGGRPCACFGAPRGSAGPRRRERRRSRSSLA